MPRHTASPPLPTFLRFYDRLALPQGLQKVGQTVMVDLPHQRQQTTDFSRWKTFTSEPVQVIPRQIGKQSALVFAKRHRPGNQQEQVVRFHRKWVRKEGRYCAKDLISAPSATGDRVRASPKQDQAAKARQYCFPSCRSMPFPVVSKPW